MPPEHFSEPARERSRYRPIESKELHLHTGAAQLLRQPSLSPGWSNDHVVTTGGLKLRREAGQHTLRAPGAIGFDEVREPHPAQPHGVGGLHTARPRRGFRPAVHA